MAPSNVFDSLNTYQARELDMCLDCQIRLMGTSIIRRELDMCLDCQIRLMEASIIRRELDMCLE
jgi:hypothetical protein